MLKSLGKCPYCDRGEIEVRPIEVQGKKVKLYACSEAKWSFEYDMCELHEEARCGFRIFSNQLQRWHKKHLSEKEIRILLSEEVLRVQFYSPKAKKSYEKQIVTDYEYGVRVLWDEG
jgi:hypothetical protein